MMRLWHCRSLESEDRDGEKGEDEQQDDDESELEADDEDGREE